MEPSQLLENMVQAIRDAVTANQRHDDIALPLFDPDKNDNGAETWCRSIEKLGAEFKWSSIQQAAKAGKALRGSALTWFETWEPETERSWETLRKDLVDLYPEKKNLSEKLSRAVLYTSDSANTYCEFAREKVRLLRSTRVAFTQPQLIELVCGGITEVNVRMASLNSSVSTIPELIALFSSYEKVAKKRSSEIAIDSNQTISNNAKRFKSGNELKPRDEKTCYTCGKSGHLMARCLKNAVHSIDKESGSQYKNLQTIKTIKDICSFCKKEGHTFEKCFHRILCTVCNKMGHSSDRCFHRFQHREQDKNINISENK
ncbi:hypothetical protein PYW07_016310 [Mythimna separata]|uniref:CCHC-type domain-containing protein n=1 Tax=Mythimna separata TaxID=271217 RepID=A0AAD7YLE4_MYTSE|nr:hypothetical protein PYW07_016310 [Mythimna separata]